MRWGRRNGRREGTTCPYSMPFLHRVSSACRAPSARRRDHHHRCVTFIASCRAPCQRVPSFTRIAERAVTVMPIQMFNCTFARRTFHSNARPRHEPVVMTHDYGLASGAHRLRRTSRGATLEPCATSNYARCPATPGSKRPPKHDDSPPSTAKAESGTSLPYGKSGAQSITMRCTSKCARDRPSARQVDFPARSPHADLYAAPASGEISPSPDNH